MANDSTPDGLPSVGATITLHRNNPGIPESTCKALTEHGVGVVDFGMGANLDPDDSQDQAETRAKQTLLDISAGGAYGAIHTKNREVVTVGYAAPRALRFLELEDSDGRERIFPAYQFERFGRIPSSRTKIFERLSTAIENRLFMGTLYQPDEGDEEKPGSETIPEAYFELDQRGQLVRPSY